MGTLLEAIEAEKSFALTPTNTGYALGWVCFSLRRLDRNVFVHPVIVHEQAVIIT